MLAFDSGLYVVDSESVSSGMPYSDSFKVKNRVCLVKMAEGSTRVIAHSALEFITNPFIFIKSNRRVTDLNLRTSFLNIVSFCLRVQ